MKLDFDGYLDITELAGDHVEGKVQNEERSSQAELKVWRPGAGDAYNMTASTKICDITGTDCYETRVVPTVKSISAHAGYTSGG